jgi:AcrR family transcriptional regulator
MSPPTVPLPEVRAPRPLGRPRAVPSLSGGDPREEILDAAAALFSTIGYTTTTTRTIAEAVGLRQASLFHYFARKEAILAELLDRAVRPTLDLIPELRRADLAPDATLWALVRIDVELLCRGPNNRGALFLLPEARGPQFASFWKARHRLFSFYRRQVLTGIERRAFPEADPTYAPDMVYGFVESVIIARPSVRADPGTPPAHADGALRMLGTHPDRIQEARRFDPVRRR